MNRGIRGAAVALCALGLSGCGSIRFGPGAAADGRLVLNRGVPLRTEHNMVVHIRGRDGGHEHDYAVLFGPYPPGPGASGEGMYVNSAPTWQSSGGYTYAIGWWPVIKTQRILAASEGTTIVVQIDAAFDRVFLLNPSRSTRLNIQTLASPPTNGVLAGEAYIQVTGPVGGALTLTGPTPIPTDPSDPIRQFLDYVLRAATTADLVD